MRLITIIVVIVALAASIGYCAQNVEGTLLSLSADSSAMVLDTGKFFIAKDAKVFRGQIGKDVRNVTLRDLAQGDHIVAVINQNGKATTVKGFFGVVTGVAANIKGNKLTFNDSRSVVLADNAQVISGDGRVGKPDSIKRGMLVKCRVNPDSGQAWTLFAAMPDKKTAVSTKTTVAKNKKEPTPAPIQPAKVSRPNPYKMTGKAEPLPNPISSAKAKPYIEPKKAMPAPPASVSAVAKEPQKPKTIAKPKINSVTYSAPSPLSAGDILTVDMSGTAGGKASFEVKDFIKPAKLDEIKPGSYHGTVTIPKEKTVHGAALLARLSVNGISASAVQASKLITVEAESIDKPVTMQAIAKKDEPTDIIPAVQPTPLPQANVPVTEPAIVPPPAPAKIALTNPPDGAKITRAILVRGTAEPDSNVLVTITYSNGLNGILKLSGEVASQMVAVGKNGEFRVGPIALEGPLATQGLEFTIKAYYPDQEDHSTASIKVWGARS